MDSRLMLKVTLMAAIALVAFSACQAPVSEDSDPTAVPDEAPAENDTAAEPSPISEPVPTDTSSPASSPTSAPAEEPTQEPTEEPTPEPTPTEEPGVVRTYQILQDQSEVRFNIDEVLLGQPNTVVGRTNQVAGQVLADLKLPGEAEVSVIEINALDLTTDNSFRNRALRSQILDSTTEEYQFITFTPTGMQDLPEGAAVVGEPVVFGLTGDLKIRDITNSVTFEITVTPVSETELSGSGVATVLRSDYDLQIPSVPGVANVAEEVRLEIDFVAVSAEES